MKYKDILKATGMTNKDIAKVFGLDYNSFINSSANKRYKLAIEQIYTLILNDVINKNQKYLQARLKSLDLSTDLKKYSNNFLINLIIK